jgi:hypothetical protein
MSIQREDSPIDPPFPGTRRIDPDIAMSTASSNGQSKARALSEKRQQKFTENPFFAAQVYKVQDDCAVEDDASPFVLLPKEGRVMTMSKTSFFNLHRKIPTFPVDVVEKSADARSILQSFLQVCTKDRKDGLHTKSLKITEECIAELNELLEKVDGLDEQFAEFCSQKSLELDDDCFPELEGTGTKKRPKISGSHTADYYTRGQAMARFIPAILSGEIAFGKKMNVPAKAFVTKFVFGLPDVLPSTGSDEAKKLFEDSVLGRLFGYCDNKVLSVLHHEDGLPIYHGDLARESIMAGEYPARVLDGNGNPSVPKFDIFYTISFDGMPLHNEWSDPLDERCCVRVSPFMYDIIKRAAFALLGNKEVWPAVLKHFFDTNEKNNSVDEVELAKHAYRTQYTHILPGDTEGAKKSKAENYTTRSYRNPSNTFYFQEAGNAEPTKYDQVLYFGSVGEKAFVQLQFAAVGTHDCEEYTASALKTHKAKTKDAFVALWALDGAVSKNSMFKATAVVLRGNRGAPEIDVDDADGAAAGAQSGGNARGSKARRTNASMASEITTLKTIVAETNAKLEQTNTKLAEMTELMLEMKTMLPAATAAP